LGLGAGMIPAWGCGMWEILLLSFQQLAVSFQQEQEEIKAVRNCPYRCVLTAGR
jgi:hypothetical protein